MQAGTQECKLYWETKVMERNYSKLELTRRAYIEPYDGKSEMIGVNSFANVDVRSPGAQEGREE
jgi:hypothetical protein